MSNRVSKLYSLLLISIEEHTWSCTDSLFVNLTMTQTNTESETDTGCQRLAVPWTRECSPGPVANWLPSQFLLVYRSPPCHCNNYAPNTLTQNTSNYEIMVSNESVDDQELFETLMMTRTNWHWLSKASCSMNSFRECSPGPVANWLPSRSLSVYRPSARV